MNVGYMMSILDLYLMKEKNGTLIIEVDNIEEIVKVKFCYAFDSTNKTFVKLDKKLFFDNINYFLKKVQGNLIVQTENLTTLNNKKIYKLVFDSNRCLSFVNFQNTELKLIRENLTNLKSDFTLDSEINNYDTKLTQNKQTSLAFSMGFSSYLTLFLTSILFLDIFMISLWVFKIFID